jgi:hypothetical protein
METSFAENAALLETTNADAEVVPTGEEGSAPSVSKADTSEDTSSWTEKAQKRYDELTRKTYEALGERDRERYQREAAQAELAALKAEKAKTSEVAPQDSFPTLEQFGYDEGKYQAAVAAHFSKIAAEQGKTAAQAALNEERERQQAEKAGQSWAQKEAELIKSKPEYVEKVKQAASLPISREIQQVLLGHELGPQIALHMVENSEAAAAIMRLPLNLQLMEVGRISAKLEAAKLAPKPVVSQAPAPVPKVDAAETALTSISTTDAASDKLSDAAWVKAENARLARKHKRAN